VTLETMNFKNYIKRATLIPNSEDEDSSDAETLHGSSLDNF